MLNWFRNLKIRNKLIASFGVVVLIGVVFSAFGIASMVQIANKSEENNRNMVEASAIEGARMNLLNQELAGKTFVLTGDPVRLQEYGTFSTLVDSGLADALKAADTAEVTKIQGVIQQKQDYDKAFAAATLDKMTLFAMMQPIQANLGNLADQSRQKMEQSNLATFQNAQSATLLAVIGMILSVVFGLFASLFLARSITLPILEFRDAAEKVSLGDLNAKVKATSKDEIGDMATAFDRMITAVRFLIAESSSVEEK